MTEQKTRAQRMAEQYGAKLDEASGVEPKARLVTQSDKTTPEQEKKLRDALKKLADFRDLT